MGLLSHTRGAHEVFHLGQGPSITNESSPLCELSGVSSGLKPNENVFHFLIQNFYSSFVK